MSCDSNLGEATVVVHMPTGLLDTVPGIDLSEPVSVVLFLTAVNLHAPPTATRGLRRLSEDGSSVSSGQASPVVTFKLLRPNGDKIEIKNASTPIEISLPYRVNSVNNSRPPCIGEPTLEPTIEVRGGLVDVASSWSCDTIVQCRFWNEAEGFWSTDGCRTIVDAEGRVGCSCNHLTEFIAFEFPLTVEELLDTILESVTINTMSISAVQCALNPRIDKDPVVWCLVMLLIVALVISLVNAVRRDRAEIAVTELLVKGLKNLSSASFSFAMTNLDPVFLRSFTQTEEGRVKMLFPENYSVRTQDLPKIFSDAAQFYWGNVRSWQSDKPVIGPDSVGVFIDSSRVQDIDTEQQWLSAEAKFINLKRF
jgi:hypothetical protein